MHRFLTPPFLKFGTAALLAGALFGIGCHDWWEDDDHDHDPPAGQGAIIIDNHTFNDVRVFFNGIRQENTRDGKSKAYNLDPGVYRVVLDEIDGDRNFREDIDVLENKVTVIDLANSGSGTRFDVVVFFD